MGGDTRHRRSGFDQDFIHGGNLFLDLLELRQPPDHDRLAWPCLRTQIFQLIQRYMDDSIGSFFEDLPTFRSLLLPFLVSFFSWFVFFTELFLIAQLFAIHVPYITFMFLLAIAATIATIPISLYGLGTRDAALVALLSLYNVQPENSISFTLFWFVIFWVVPSIIGAVITVLESKKLPPRKKKSGNNPTLFP